MHLLDHRQAANPGANVYAHSLGVGVGHRKAGITKRLHSRCNAVMNERIHMARLFGGNVLLQIETLHFAGDMAGNRPVWRFRVKAGDASDARFASQGAGPSLIAVVADRADNPDPGDDYPALVWSESQLPLLKGLSAALRFFVRVDVVNRLLHGGDFFRVFVGNFGLELVFERHHKLHCIERIRAEIVHKRRFDFDFSFVDAQLFGNDFFDALFDVIHVRNPSRYKNEKRRKL